MNISRTIFLDSSIRGSRNNSQHTPDGPKLDKAEALMASGLKNGGSLHKPTVVPVVFPNYHLLHEV